MRSCGCQDHFLCAYHEGWTDAVNSIVAWHRKKARRYRLLNHLEAWHAQCADAIERGDYEGSSE